MSNKEYNETNKEGGLFRFGESYTSLVLGIVVVIVSTVLLLSFVHNKNVTKLNNENVPVEKIANVNQPTGAASDSAKVSITVTAKPTAKSAVKPTTRPTAAPKVAKKPTATTAVKKTAKDVKAPTPTASNAAKAKKAEKAPAVDKKGVYTVVKGDNLWVISERIYMSGYNWVDISRVNKLSNPDEIEAGTKLVLPKVKSKTATVVQAPKSKKVVQKEVKPDAGKKIAGGEYKVVKGDSLWSISVRAYVDGYQWTKIAKANNLKNPNLIHSGNKLKIPRGK
jgi:nucleoid-associated protein YgaU